MIAAQIGDRYAGLMLQDPDDLFFRKAAALHALALVVGQSELQTGLSPWSKVKQSPFSDGVVCHQQKGNDEKYDVSAIPDQQADNV